MPKTNIDIVLPCYNPIQNWQVVIYESYKELSKDYPDINWRFILVNDGSSEHLEAEKIQFLENEIPNFNFIDNATNFGKGYALRAGVKTSTAEICIYTDVDFPYKLESLTKLTEILLQQKADVVVGVKRNAYYKNVPFSRKMVSKSLRWLIRKLLNISITDTQCGLKGFNKKGKDIFLQTSINRYLFDLEFVFLAENNKNCTIISTEIDLKEGIVFSKLNFKILLTESRNFGKVLMKSYFGSKE